MVASVYEFVRLIAFAVIVLVLAFQKTKRFLLADALLGLSVCSLPFLRPKYIESQVTIQQDNVHLFMQQIASCFTLFHVLFYFFFVRPARDEDAAHGLLGTRTLIQGILTIILALDEWRFPKLFKDTFFPSVVLVCLMWACLSAYHLYRSGINMPKRGRLNPINLYIKIDIVLALLLGGSDMFFAKYTLASMSWKMDDLHVHMATGCGALHFSAAILGMYALGFRNITERKGYLCCRITVLLLIGFSMFYAVVVKKMPLTQMDMALMATLFVPIIPAMAGLLLTKDRRSFSSSSAGYNLRTRSQ